MTDVNLFDLYRHARTSAFRLEVQQRYAVPAEETQFRIFLADGVLPEVPAIEGSMAVIRAATEAGTRIYRVHVVELPLTRYLRYELAAYSENVRAGEEVRITVRSRHADLARLTQDFVLFDGETEQAAVVWMNYDEDGRIVSRDFSDTSSDIDRACRDRDLAMAHSVTLGEFAGSADVI